MWPPAVVARGCALTVAVALIQMPSSFRVAPAIALIFAMLFSTLGAVFTYKRMDPWVESEKKDRGEAVVDQRGNITMIKTVHGPTRVTFDVRCAM